MTTAPPAMARAPIVTIGNTTAPKPTSVDPPMVTCPPRRAPGAMCRGRRSPNDNPCCTPYAGSHHSRSAPPVENHPGDDHGNDADLHILDDTTEFVIVGTFNFTVAATDANGCTGEKSASKETNHAVRRVPLSDFSEP
jgi:hypothetical protein